MTNSRPTLSEDLISKVLAIKPSYLTNTGFINYLIELGYQTRLQQQKNMQDYIHNKPKELTRNIEQQKEELKEKNKKEKQEEKVIPEDLNEYRSLIIDYWKGKKGAKTKQAWKMQITEFRKFITKYGKAVLKDQLEAAILDGTWKSIKVINYEQYYLKNNKFTNPEPNAHPNVKVFKASEANLPPTLAELKLQNADKFMANKNGL